ncbi:hypothetical protein P7K49_002267, partial [Saguinus oedipus]
GCQQPQPVRKHTESQDLSPQQAGHTLQPQAVGWRTVEGPASVAPDPPKKPE